MKSIVNRLKNFFIITGSGIKSFLQKYPYWSLFICLGLLLLLAITSNYLSIPKPDTNESKPNPKQVETFRMGTNPLVTSQAKVEKTGVTKVIAQSGGVVQYVNVKPGAKVYRGTRLAYISNTGSGLSIQTISKTIAQKNLDFQNSTYDLQKEIIEKQRSLAEKQDENSDRLREIQRQSESQTQASIDLSTDTLNSINDQISALESNNADHSKDAEILQMKQAKIGLETGLLSLKGSLESSQFQSNDSNPPAKLSNLSKELARKQLELQEQSLDLSKEMANLNLTIAEISESLLYPESPFAGVVERVYVKAGETVAPGTVIASIKGSTISADLIALVPSELAKSISRLDDTLVDIGDESIKIKPAYISEEATDGSLHSVIYTLSANYINEINDGDYVSIQIPVESAKSISSVPFIPLDSLYQTKTDSYVFVVSKSGDTKIAQSKTIKVGQVIGSYVEVKEGLEASDIVILDRNVISGDLVEERQ